MNKTLTRLFTVALLMMVSMGARAEIKIDLGGKDNKGIYEGGTVTAKQSEAKDGKVTVTLTFTPYKNYSITRKDVLLAYTAPTNTSGNTRADNPTLGETFNPSGSDDVFAYPNPATYTVTVDANLGLSVQNVEFKNSRDSGAKAGGDEDPKPIGYDFSGTYYIANHNRGNYDPSDYKNNFYLCLSTNTYDADGNMPFLTTYKERTTDEPYPINSRWIITFAKTIDKVDYYYLQHYYSKKYLTWNEQLVETNPDRVRVHLQSNLDEDNEDNNLFYFEAGNIAASDGDYNISPKAWANRNKGASLNPAKDNLNYYDGQDYKSPGSFIDKNGITVYCAGLIGVYDKNDGPGIWYFEEVVARPTITLNGSNLVEINSTETGTIHYTTDGSDPTSNSTAYSGPFSIPNGAKAIKAIVVRTSDNEVSSVVTLKVTATFHVVNKANQIALSYSGSVSNLVAPPSEIRSPYIPNNANYKLFTTKDAAYAYSIATTDAARNLAAEAATSITSDNQTFYVGYYYDETSQPADLPVLDGSKYYQMISNYGGTDNNYIYKPNSAAKAGSHTSGTFTDSNHLWHFIGNDPYDIRVANKGVNDSKNDGEEWLLTHNSTITDRWYRTVTDYSSNGASMVMLRSDANHYNLAIISDAEASDYNYLYFFGANGTNSNNVYFMRNNAAASPIYTSDRPGAQLKFNYVTANYIYNIVDTHGNVAIKYSVNDVGVGTPLTGYDDIPEAIRSPYLEGETITFYSNFTEGSRDNLSNPITNTPAGGGNIYVAYTTEHLTDIEKPLHLRGNRPFKIRVNGEYVFDNNGSFSHTTSDGAGDNSYQWKVSGGDPYAVYIQNIGNAAHYFNWNTSGSPTLTLGASSRFIIFGGSVARPEGVPEGFNDQLELMAAAGEDISSSNYYNVGRASDVGLLASNAYPHGHDAIQVLLKAEQRNVTFHIIDMSGRIVVEQSGAFDDLAVPEQWKSPLVQTYHYYKFENFRVTNGVYTLRQNQTGIDDFLNAPADIYVTYDPSDEYDLDGSENRTTDGKKYLLKFAGGTSFKQEKDDDFEATAAPGIYPYINGEGGLFVYGQDKLDATAGAVGSTRTRWAWYLEGGDPYRLRISSLQTKTDGVDDTRHSYLRTYKPQGYDQVVTGVISNTPEIHDASDDAHAERHKPTDYMILNGTGTHFKLVTSDVVDDLDGNAANDVRHTVTSFENYWKTNPTAAKLIHAKDETFVVGSTPTDEQITAVLTTGSDAIGWHTYNVWANGSTWTSSSKVFGYGPHWFKTIGVGTESGGTFNGDFDLEEYDLDGALILLDQHGWEVMRKPITNLSTKKAAYATELRKYDSPMVKKYHFWTNFIKEDGYHKYKPIRNNSSASKNAQHKGEGTSLADYPEVFSTGTLADIYVTYEVMGTYRDGYTGAATAAGTRASKYLIRQGEKYAKTTDGSTIIPEDNVDLTAPSSIGDELLWYVKPNFNIDTEMGYNYSGSKDEKTQAETESAYYANRDATVYDTTNGQNGFDPYNLQIESAKAEYSGKLFTTNAAGAGLDDSGGLVSTYNEGEKTVTLQSYAQAFYVTANYYDSGTGYQIPHVTNSTFMAVSDANGNIRLMPRFDHHNVSTSFTALADQQDPAPYGDESGTQTTLFVLPSTSSPTPSGEPITISSSDEITDMNGYYILSEDFDVTKVVGTKAKPFKGTIDGQLYTIDGLSRPLVAYADGATIKNVIVKTVSINAGNADGNAGAICCQATGATRIYNCGILPATTERDNEGNITGFSGSHVSGSTNVGGIVGLLSDESRVINCFSYANVSGGNNAAGIVGNNAVATTANSSNSATYLKTMVMNCMFYGNITSASIMKPVYGGQRISNAGENGINNYNYYRNGKDVTFDDNYSNFDAYYCTLPADEEYLTRFEYYRSILNSNKKLCTWWINGTSGTAPTDDDVDAVGIAKWVLDPEIAPFPILKKWGKYPSVINQDPEFVWNPKTQQKVSRATAEPYHGKQLGTISVTVNAGTKHAGTGATSTILPSVIVMDMDTLNHDYGYAKIQLPYYNEVFGDPSVQLPDPSAEDYTSKWNNRYGGNYKDYVVTGWKIKSVTGGKAGSFKGYAVTSVPDAISNVSAGTVTPDEVSTSAWEDGFNFADRKCTNKDLYSKSGRVFAQGGYYYVPEGVTAITIEAYWGKAVYLHNSEHSIDRVNVAAQASGDGSGDGTGADFGSAFTPAGTLSTTFQTYAVKEDLQAAIAALTNNASYTVYDQAIVLVGNVQVKNRGGSLSTSGTRPFTIMSCDLDLDNEPDYCLQFQQRNTTNRPAIHPVRFDFLPVPELGLAIRTNTFAYAIGLMVPKGHFEITETSFMHTTQFEYDAAIDKTEAPLILNGGNFEQIVVRYGTKDRTSYILMGGNFRIKRFTPGYHASPTVNSTYPAIRHCAVNAIGGEYPEFYLSGIYAPDQGTRDNDNPHCYTNGGYFGLVAGAGYEQVKGDVTFKIDHSIIDEFYGGGINAAKPVTGIIDVTINNSLVGIYCGGPKVGVMSTVDGKLKTVTTNATGTTFGVFYGGGNGGTSYYRERKRDNTGTFPSSASAWDGYTAFNPLNQESAPNAAYQNGQNAKWGYHAEYEFEVFNSSNGLKSGEDVIRVYYRWAQFGTTTTGDVTSTLTDCTVTGNFFGGGNLANVTGNITSILKGNTHIYGSAFAGGFSASIPFFPVHDKNTVRIPTHDPAGNVDEQGSLDYYQDGGKDRMYTWCYKNASGKVLPEGVVIPSGYSAGTKQKSVFRYPDTDDGKWYVLTTESLEGLGSVSGNTNLTLDDNCVVDGSVFGGGDASTVNGNTTVNLQGNTQVFGNVFGGGNVAEVGGSATVNIRPETPTNNNNSGGDTGEGSGGN